MIRNLIIAAALAAAPASAQVIATDWSAEVVVDNTPVPPMLHADNPTDLRKGLIGLCARVPDALKLKCLTEISRRSFASLTEKGADQQRYMLGLDENLAGGWKTYIVIYAQTKAP